MTAPHELTAFVVARLGRREDGRPDFEPWAQEELLACFRQMAHQPDAEEAGEAALRLIALFNHTGAAVAAETLARLVARVLDELARTDSRGRKSLLERFEGRRRVVPRRPSKREAGPKLPLPRGPMRA
jgi:hypothetical protein